MLPTSQAVGLRSQCSSPCRASGQNFEFCHLHIVETWEAVPADASVEAGGDGPRRDSTALRILSSLHAHLLATRFPRTGRP